MGAGSTRVRSTAGEKSPAELGCAEWSNETLLFVDGELGEAERLSVELHLDECPGCGEAVRWHQALRAALQRKVRQATSGGTGTAALLARVCEAIDRETPVPPRLERFRRLLRPVPVATAAGATALGLGLSTWFFTPPARDDLVRDIVERHARRLPLEIQSSDPQSLEAWLADKVDFRVKVPRLAGGVLSLEGARLSHVKDHAAVYLLYGRAQSPTRRVSLLMYDDPQLRAPLSGSAQRIDDRDVYRANAAGYNVAIWKENEVVYSLISDSDEDVMEMIRAANR